MAAAGSHRQESCQRSGAMPLRRVTLLVFVVVALASAACGGDSGMSADDYRTQLDAACERLQEQNASIPVTVNDENLTVDDARELARRYGEELRERVESLDPPEELGDAHQRLLDVGEETPPSGDDLDAVRAWMLEIADVYGDLGAGGCERAQRAAAEQLARAQP